MTPDSINNLANGIYENLSQMRVAVAGAGVTGRSVAKVLREQGAEVFFIDDKVSTVENFEVRRPGESLADDFDALMISPGWRADHPLIIKARAANKAILNEIDFAWSVKNQLNPGQQWLALTGTNGKTTTVEMVAHIMREAKINGVACGNVGRTVIDSVIAPERYDYLIIELSSFQLHWMKDAEFAAVAILNIADDHIDWHGSFAAYAGAKVSLLDRSTLALLNADDGEVVAHTSNWQGRKVFYSLDTPAPGELGIVEELLVDRAFVANPQEAEIFAELTEIIPTAPHQISNALAAAGLAASIGISHKDIRVALKTFQSGAHRIEQVCTNNGILWIDDSKATNPHAAAASILSHLSVIWIAGGVAKGAKMAELVERVIPRVKAAILIGADRDLIARELEKFAPELPIIFLDTPPNYFPGAATNEFMEEIVRQAQKLSASGDAILLAPACASMDQFLSYADRGDRFQQAVRKVILHEQ